MTTAFRTTALGMLLARAKTAASNAPKRVRPIDRSASAGDVIEVGDDGWIFWIGDDGWSHLSHPSYVERA